MSAIGNAIAVNVQEKVKVPILPSFFVIGPPRTGTSWLYSVLSECTRLSRPTKETRFFDKHFGRGLDWYGNHYRGVVEGSVVGEIAPTYFASASARDRIARLIPHAKIVCTFRNPVDRIVSLYRLKRAYGLIPWTFDDALIRDPELMESSRYAAHLQEWQKTFGESQIMATVHEELEADPQSYIDKVVDFLRAPRVKLRPAQMNRVLATENMTQPRHYCWTRAALKLADWSKAKCLGSVVEAAKGLGLARVVVGGGPAFPELPASRRRQLRQFFKPEVEALESLLNRDLSAWK
jgi:hypothetical protein